ncbi:MAG: NAD+ synthase [Bacteroidetes bacterium]|nr:NAD+ synthase [Bacteroidota bacterium]
MLPQLKLDAPAVADLLSGFIAEEIGKTGLSRAIIGLSGGVDSALSAALAVRALGHDNVFCVMMPYRSSSPESVDHARLLADVLGVPTELVDITAMVDPLIEREPDMDRLRRGNIMARERMIVLYDRSSRERGLVVGTGNKTELLLGYSTLFGDSACAINPLGDLYKTQVWQLAEWLEIPEVIVRKAPSADLWSGQTDEQELGFTYERVDALLVLMVDERLDDDELHERGFDAGFVTTVRRMIRRNQFKRLPPVIAKVGYRTVNADFRYPRDWGL